MTEKADVAVIGTGVMGRSLARNFARHGHTVALFDVAPGRAAQVAQEHSAEGNFIPAQDPAKLAQSMSTPRVAILLVPAGEPTDKAIDMLCEVFSAGDIIVDMGNSFYLDTERREKLVTQRGLHFVGCGISGGESGALNGPAIMPGGAKKAYERLGPLLESISAHYQGEPCCTWVGPGGAGHYVKMVHNGIEYADMELLSEAYQLLRYRNGMSPKEISEVFSRWNEGPLHSYLLEISADILQHTDEKTHQPFIDIICDQAGQKGTGSWTVQNALTLGAGSTIIAAATFARAVSSQSVHRTLAREVLGEGVPDTVPGGPDLLDTLEKAVYGAKIVAYSQGLSQIRAACKEYGWTVDLAKLAAIWRAGCIIQAQLLQDIMETYQDGDFDTPLLLKPAISAVIKDALPAWRAVVSDTIKAGIALPALSSGLAYLDSLRCPALPTALVQAQRDFFGAHTYRRRDCEGSFHTRWENPQRPEISLS